MYTRSRTCEVLPKIITKVRQVAGRPDFQDDVLTWFCPPLNGSLRRLYTTLREVKYIPCSSKTLAQTKKEQRWSYDPTIKYEALRQCAVPRYAYCYDSATDWADSSDSEIETETMTEEEALTQKDNILVEAKEEQPFPYDPTLNYEILKQYFYIDSPDSLAYSNLICGSDTMEERQSKLDKYCSETTQEQLHICNSDSETKRGTETMAEVEAQKDKLLAGTKEEQPFLYDSSIEYEPLKRYVIPRFAFYDSSSTDWSDSSDSSAFSDYKSETMAEEEAQSQEDKILAGSSEKLFLDNLVKSPSTNLQSVAEDLAKSPSRNLQSKPAVSGPFILVQVKHGAKSPAEVDDKVSERAKEMDLYTGVDKVTNDDQKEGGESLICG